MNYDTLSVEFAVQVWPEYRRHDGLIIRLWASNPKQGNRRGVWGLQWAPSYEDRNLVFYLSMATSGDMATTGYFRPPACKRGMRETSFTSYIWNWVAYHSAKSAKDSARRGSTLSRDDNLDSNPKRGWEEGWETRTAWPMVDVLTDSMASLGILATRFS